MTRNADARPGLPRRSRCCALCCAVALLTLSLCSCGGRTAAGPATAAPPATGTPGGLPGLDELDSRPLPAPALIPAPAHAASAWPPANYREFKGADYFLACPGAVVASETELDLPLPATTASWAIYAVDGLAPAGTTVAGWSLLTGTSTPEDTFMAIANYRTGRWEPRQGVPERQFQILAGRGDYVSPAGRFYLAVFGWPRGYTAGNLTITRGSFVLDDGSVLSTPSLEVSALPGALGVEFSTWDLRTAGYGLRITGPGKDEALEFPYFNDTAAYYFTGLTPGAEYTVTVHGQSVAGDSGEAAVSATPTPGWEHMLTAGPATQFTLGCALADGSYIAASPELLARYAADGTPLASQLLAAATLSGLAAAADGGCFAVGRLPHPAPEYPSMCCHFLARLRPDFSVAWIRGWTATDNAASSGDPGLRVAASGDAVYVSSTDVIWGAETQYALELRRFSADGTLAWARWRDATASGEYDAAVNGLAITADGAVWAGGWRSGGEEESYARALLLTRWTPQGTIAWERQGSTSAAAPDEFYALCPDGAGGVYAGAGEGSAFYLSNMLVAQARLLRVNADGGLAWQRTFTGSEASSFHALLPDGAGGVWAGGNGQPNIGYLLGSGLLTRWDASGAVLDVRELANWVKTDRRISPSIAVLLPADGGGLVAVGNDSGMSSWLGGPGLDDYLATPTAEDGNASWQAAAALAREYGNAPCAAELAAGDSGGVEHDLLRGSYHFNGGGWYNGLVFRVEP